MLSRRSDRPTPTSDDVLGQLQTACAAGDDINAVADATFAANDLLRGVPGVTALVADPKLAHHVNTHLDTLVAIADAEDATLESSTLDQAVLEQRSAAVIRLRDAVWAIREDRLRAGKEVADLAGRSTDRSVLAGYLAVHRALSAIDRLEVRGRDSAGIHLFVTGHDLNADDATLRAALAERATDPAYPSGAVRFENGVLSFVYKTAAEIGELGDNTAALRAGVAGDELLRRAISAPDAQVSIVGHTRWASVGIVSIPNTHPINSEEVVTNDTDSPYIVAALNGDVDNHVELKHTHDLQIHPTITTDAKVIPTIMARHAVGDISEVEAFRRTVTAFEGSVAVAAMSAATPGSMLLALQGSGQGLYIGLAEDCYLVASEPYGVVEETDALARLDGENGGEVMVLDGAQAGSSAGLTRINYDGSPSPITPDDIGSAGVTTRDIDRGEHPHFLLKEIGESPSSFRKTLRGRIEDNDGELRACLDEFILPTDIINRLANGSITRVRVIGQGTAAVAGQSAAALLNELCDSQLDVAAIVATELSGFHLRLDMSDTLAIAVSQSGTTTDTNTTVDLLRARGAAVIGIVNRRASDLVDKADGVLYTSNGRDVEMSVASTKAFYAQVAAGALLSCAISEAAGLGSNEARHRLLDALKNLPTAMEGVLGLRDEIAAAARLHAPQKRYWAVVGNGPNAVAAREVRIKLSELCYKSMAADITEDKKHIDLSSEPLILVCAAGLEGSTADDVAKETAIFRAHKATPIVVANAGETRYSSAATIGVPIVHPALGFVLSAMVGHLFGYEAALAIDASANPLRESRELIDDAIQSGVNADAALGTLRRQLPAVIEPFHTGLSARLYDGHLEASTAIRLVSLVRDLTSEDPVETFSTSTGKVGTPSGLINELIDALTDAIDELTRPIDAIKHQAKTVTVGISRSDENVIDRPLVQETLAAGAGRDVLSYRVLKTLAALSPTVAKVVGYTRYRISNDTVSIVDRAGIARELPSRTDQDSRLLGTKRHVASEQDVLVARGLRDGRTLIFVPEVRSGVSTGITLLHVTFHEHLGADEMASALQGYDDRYARLVDWVTERSGDFDQGRLGEISVSDLLITPISQMASYWQND